MTPTLVTFPFTGAPQYYTVPSNMCNGVISVTIFGAGGCCPGSGAGARLTGTLAVTPGQVLQINVGGCPPAGNSITGGWNGGGNGGAQNVQAGQLLPCGGGGATDIRVAPYALANRILVAGGGGGRPGGDNFSAPMITGGNGGCNNGTNGSTWWGGGGGGGTQVSGGAGGAAWANISQPGSPGVLGVGGKGGDDLVNIWAAGGGGGGGYYGGGGGGADGCCPGANGGGGGGGGSSFYPPGFGCTTGATGNTSGNGGVAISYTPGGFNLTITPSLQTICTNSMSLSNFQVTISNYSNSSQTYTYVSAPLGFNYVGGNATLNVNTYTYTWLGPNNFSFSTIPASTANPNTPSTSVVPTIVPSSTIASGIYTLTINSGGCLITNTMQLVVQSTPTITSLTNNGPVCQGTNAIFNMAVSTTTGNQTFQWTGPNGFNSNLQNPTINNVTPANSGMYSVTVVNNYSTPTATQCITSSVIPFFVVGTSPLNVTPSFTQCQGTNIILTANAFGASSYSWSGPSNFTSNIANPTLTLVNPTVHPGNYTVTASFTSPQTTLVCTNTAVTSVSVVPMNPITLINPPFLCQGSNFNFSANAPQAAGYVWTGPNGFTSNTAANTINSVVPANSGIYSVTAIFAIGTVSCYTHNSFSFDVVPINPVITIPYIEICDKEGTTLTSSAQNAASYTWYGPNGFSVNTQNAVFQNLNPTWSGIYTVTAMFTNGYLNCYNSNTTQLNVKPRLYFDLGPDKRICYNGNIALVGPSGATGYTWTSSTSFTSNSQNAVIPNAMPANAGIYILTVDLNGCKTYDTVKVDILTPISWSLVPTNKSVCRGDKIEISVGVEGGSQNIAYNWNPPVLSGPTGSVQIGNGVNTTVFNVTAYDIACPDYTIGYTFSVEVKQPPIPQLELTKNYQCEPMCQVFNSKVGSQSALVMYDFGDNRVYTGDSIEICLPKGTYNLKIYTTGQNGCKGTFTISSPIVVYPKPGADFYWTPEIPNTTENQVTFIPTIQHGTQ
ncbi:MAG: glycine-rich protein, partial [Bacteroidia bacterium]|nr:glycine-rich protein [Bacteroidia bacterium]